MKSVCSSIALVALAIAGLSSAPIAAAADDVPQVHQSGGINYITGGVSEEERAVLNGMARDFNVKMIFATRQGEYLSDTEVVVSSGRGQTVLETKSNGPWFYARLPAGQYQVAVTSNGRTQRRTASVGGRGLKTLDFRWESLEGPRIRPVS